MRTTFSRNGKQIVVTRSAAGWKVRVGGDEAVARYLDDALARALPSLPPGEHDRVMVWLLQWANRKRQRIVEKRRRRIGLPHGRNSEVGPRGPGAAA